MVSYLAVIFFCVGESCYFWSSKALHTTETACLKEVAPLVMELEKESVKKYFQCLKVPIIGA